ncbi:MAG: endonuclease V [Candidatus Hodarchaeota archaeon]
MTFKEELLGNNYSFEQAELIQIKYQNLINIISKDDIDNIKLIKTIVGVDISYYHDGDKEYGVACAVLWNIEHDIKEEHNFARDLINFPYKPGFLGFRECKLLTKAISKLPIQPDLIMCDGHGKIHPRRFGEAVHLGFALNIPTIGIAKNPFIGYFNKNGIKKTKGFKIPVWAKNPENISKTSLNDLLGYAICLNDGSKPVYISVGYKTTIEIALKISLITAKGHRQPEPLYLADRLSKQKAKSYTS